MSRFVDRIARWYDKCVLDHPLLVICTLVVVMAVLGYLAKDFKIDASAETLLLENDADLRYTRQINSRYGVHDFLIIAVKPKQGDLLADANLLMLKKMQTDLLKLKEVSSVFSILDVPLLESPPIPYAELSEGIPTLQSPKVDKALARKEFEQSPFYRQLIVSTDMRTTAIIVNLKPDEIYHDLLKKRNHLQELKTSGQISEAQLKELKSVGQAIRVHLDQAKRAQHANIAAVRSIMDKYRAQADLFLGGISMIADDMISFIKKDLDIFGAGVFLLLVAMLGLIFKHLRWIVLPMLCCFLSVIAMMGILGAFGLDVTVISSNFISLQLIITLAMVVHLVVRYREILFQNPQAEQRTLVRDTVRSKFTPSLYAALTTIAGFGSLLLCDIKPVINFGWMMSAGLVVSLLLTFVLFPAGVMLLKKKPLPPAASGKSAHRYSIVPICARLTEAHGTAILAATVVVSVLTVLGISRLVVENSFIDYFKQSTEIYQGMKVIDEKLGGTTPLDVIVQFKAVDLNEAAGNTPEEEEFPDPFKDVVQENNDKYWFFDDRLEVAEKVQDYLQALPETGKVLSLGTLLKIGRNLNKGKTLDSLDMAVLYTKLPQHFKDLILKPYVSIKDNELRFSVRIKDSLKTLKRDALLKKIRHDMINKLHLPKDGVHLAGTMVLYNNMLQSLFSSQIKTLGVVALALMLMFLGLFRSLKVALIALFPNLLASASVLGIMGWFNIPLDMMTITIAAISIGIAVDDTIHYIYRFREEIKKYDGHYLKTMHHCHSTIGHAMYYTSITIIIGFSILVFSNFLPTIYFGVFTGIAMMVALIAALTLLPELILLFKPFGPDSGKP